MHDNDDGIGKRSLFTLRRVCDCCGKPMTDCLHARIYEACLSDLVERTFFPNRKISKAAQHERDKLKTSPDFEAEVVRRAFERLRKLQAALIALETIV